MIRKSHYLREDQIKFLESLPGKPSEHLRIAIDNYQKLIEKDSVSTSPSKKGSDSNG